MLKVLWHVNISKLLTLSDHYIIEISMPIMRVSQELYDKVCKISKQTGLSMRVILDKMGENIDIELKIIVKEKE